MPFRSAFRLRSPALLCLVLLAACTPIPRPVSAPAIVAPPPPGPQPAALHTGDWRDIPLAAGTWRYADGPATSAARYGQDGLPAQIVVRCDKANRQIAIMRQGSTSELVITTSSGTERFAAGRMEDGGVAMSGALFDANNPLLDRIAFSRGRFVLAGAGLAMLAVPAWAEPARTIEDCRK